MYSGILHDTTRSYTAATAQPHVPLTKPQKEKLARNKAGLRALTKKSVSLKKKKAILQKGGFLEDRLWI
jgi:hypothetical protein